MTAICLSCGRKEGPPPRGAAKVRERKCPSCGGSMRGPTAGRPSPSMGRRYEWCVVCGAKSIKHNHPRFPFRLRDAGDGAGAFPAGSPVCGSHALLSDACPPRRK